jgi:hypothetical protein
LDELNKLKPNGECTALYDAIIYCLKLYPPDSKFRLLTILTDGDDKFSDPENRALVLNKHEFFIIKETNQLHIKGRFVHIGDSNIGNTKGLSDRLGYDFHHTNSGNASTFTQTFNQITSITATRSPAGINTGQISHCINPTFEPDVIDGISTPLRESLEDDTLLISLLPEPPPWPPVSAAPIRLRKQTELAD